jgi:hypothetical protein
MRGRYAGGVAAEIEDAAEEWAKSRDAADDHADAVFGVAPDEDVGDTD